MLFYSKSQTALILIFDFRLKMHSRESNQSLSSESFDMNLKQVEQTNQILMNMESKLQNFIKKKNYFDTSAPNFSNQNSSNLNNNKYFPNQSPRRSEPISGPGSNRPKDFSPGVRGEHYMNKANYSPPNNLKEGRSITSRPPSKNIQPETTNYFSPSDNMVKSNMELDKELRHLSQRLINFDQINDERPIRSYEKM